MGVSPSLSSSPSIGSHVVHASRKVNCHIVHISIIPMSSYFAKTSHLRSSPCLSFIPAMTGLRAVSRPILSLFFLFSSLFP
jgi:hypothetical protein